MRRMAIWIDTHAHLDAPEFHADQGAVFARALSAGVRWVVVPAVMAEQFDTLPTLAHAQGQPFALGIHPLFTPQAKPEHLEALRAALQCHRDNPLLVAVGEIGLDQFVPGLDLATQLFYYEAQLKLAREFGLPVILHVRRSADLLLKGLRKVQVPGGIAHAFNGSPVQAQQFVQRGFRLGFGGAMTFERALQIRHLARTLPAHSLVLETDAPDIPPHWLYRTAAQRAAGEVGRNEPAQLPRIAQTLAQLRGWSMEQTAEQTTANALVALPKLAGLAAA
jgi:TatD DNase family protein